MARMRSILPGDRDTHVVFALLLMTFVLTGCTVYFGDDDGEADPPFDRLDAGAQVDDTYVPTPVFGGRCNIPTGVAAGSLAVWIWDNTPGGPGACIVAADANGPGSWWCLREFATKHCDINADCPTGTRCEQLPRFDSIEDPRKVCRPPSVDVPLQFVDLPPPCEVAAN